MGGNRVEYDALKADFTNRGRRGEEQIAVIRQLWTQPVNSFEGSYHRLQAAGLNPLPVHRPIPIWLGGDSEIAMRRAGKLADEWLPHGRPDGTMARRIADLRVHSVEAGGDALSVQIDGRPSISEVQESAWRDEPERCYDLGVSQLGINTMGTDLSASEDHRCALARFAAKVPLVRGQVHSG